VSVSTQSEHTLANREVLLYTLCSMGRPLDNLLAGITAKKERLDSYRPLSPALVRNLEEWFRVELTYSSNAIEGNTLSRNETALVVEKGITVRGKSLREHLEAINHAEALDYVATLATRSHRPITRHDILSMHSLILRRIDDDNAGRLRTIPVKIAGSAVAMPPPLQVPDLMDDFVRWLNVPHDEHPATFAADAHLRFVTIHPFVDGNGRTGRLLMNLLLMRRAYPPALVRKEDREEYIGSLEQVQFGGSPVGYYSVIYGAVERSLDIYLQAVEAAEPAETGEAPHPHPAPTLEAQPRLLKIGDLARQAGESISTIRYWTKEGLLAVASHTPGGYQLYDPAMLERISRIRLMQQRGRLTIAEIRAALLATTTGEVATLIDRRTIRSS
jgi:fido (protein-threonine AMPylation protein)